MSPITQNATSPTIEPSETRLSVPELAMVGAGAGVRVLGTVVGAVEVSPTVMCGTIQR